MKESVEQWGTPEPNPVIAEVTKPRSGPDYSGESLRFNGNDVADTILRGFGVDVNDPIALQTVMRAEKDARRKAQLSNLYRKWQEEKSE